MAYTLILRYNGTPEDRFDRDYYCHVHLPRANKEWAPYGLISARAFFPAQDDQNPATVCICECIFKDEASMKAAFKADCTPGLMADIPNFTDLPMTPEALVSMG